MKTRGIILLGGKGNRLKPLTKYISKHLLPVYNKPMVYYSLSSLVYSNISEILIICNKNDLNIYQKLLKPIAKKYNIKFSFEFQKKIGGGIAESLLIGAKFINSCEKIVLILGDNFFYGREFPRLLKKAMSKKNKSYVFLSPVKKAKNFGVAYLDKRKKLKKIIEKPSNSKSNLAVTGLYVYSTNHINNLHKLKRSRRGELEITTFNNRLLKNDKLDYINLGQGITWFDLGSFNNLYQCSEFVKVVENRQGKKISGLL